MSGRCLIVANQTLGSDALRRSVEDCLGRDVTDFYVVVPRTPVEHETPAWTGGFALSKEPWSPEKARAAMAAVQEGTRLREAEVSEAQVRAQGRLELMIEAIHSMGGTAAGEVGAPDPLKAAKGALDEQPAVDEIIVSTLPKALSRWLRMDLPNRLARITHVPVTTIEAQDS